MHLGFSRATRAVAGLTALAALAACAPDSISSPAATPDVEQFAADPFNLGETSTDSWFAAAGTVRVCNFNIGGATYTVSDIPGRIGTGSFTLSQLDQCVIVWQAPAGYAGGSSITVTQTPAGGTQPAEIRILSTTMPDVYSLHGPNSVTEPLPVGRGLAFWFKNVPFDQPPPPPPPGGEGCTPGYWKQSQHFDSWRGYTPNQDFDTVFGVNVWSPNLTLVQTLAQGGGGIKALGRHAVAALLNASANSGVDYPLTTAQVISAFQAAVAGGPDAITAQKNIFAAMNEAGCPLN